MRRRSGRRRLPVVVRMPDGSVVCTAGRADSFGRRGLGLLGRAGLRPDEGLWIRPCRSIHTMFMRFAIDAVFLDDDNVVVRIAPCVRPFRFAMGGRGARSVIELPAGRAEALGLSEGFRLRLEDTEPVNAEDGEDPSDA